MVRQQHTVAVKEPMTLQALLTGFKFVYASKIILGIITLDMFAVFLGGATALLPIYAKEFCSSGRADSACCRRRCRWAPCSACSF